MVSKAKAAKLVRALVDLFLDMEAGTGSEVSRDGLPPDFSGKLTIFLLGEKWQYDPTLLQTCQSSRFNQGK